MTKPCSQCFGTKFKIRQPSLSPYHNIVGGTMVGTCTSWRDPAAREAAREQKGIGIVPVRIYLFRAADVS